MLAAVQESDGDPSTVDEEPCTGTPPLSPRPRASIDISKTFSVGERLVDLEQTSTSGRPEQEPPGKRGPDDFELLRVVGKGAFGKVSIFGMSLFILSLGRQGIRLARQNQAEENAFCDSLAPSMR